MLNFDDNNLEENEDSFSDSFLEWDESQKKGLPPGYFDPDELCEIIDTYLSLDKVAEGKIALEYALRVHPDNEDMIYDIMQILNDYELWDDLLYLTNQYKHIEQVWIDGHKITSLLHLGMEENAFTCFRQAKQKYASNKEDLSIIYQAMAEALYDIDLYDAAINVIKEILSKIDIEEKEDLLWIQLQSYLALKDTENVQKLCDQIIKSNPMDAETWSRLGLIYKEIGEKEKSIDAFEFAASLGKKEPIDMLNLIYSYKENGNFLKALEIVDEYLDKSPNDYIINLLASNICMEIEDWEKALKYTDKAISIGPSSDFLYLYKSKCFLKLGEVKKAIKALDDGIIKSGDKSNELKSELERIKKENPEY